MMTRHKELGLSDQEVLEMYRLMLLARKVDERMWLLNRAGKIPFVISCQGQEAAQVGAAFALDRTVDYVAPYYRDVGIVLAFGMTVEELLMSGFGKAGDPNSGGRQMPGHFGQRKNRIITGSSPVTTQVPHAVGFALASRLRKEPFVTFTSLGDGSTNQGDFHEGLNFAGVHQLPVITFVENNRLAISVPYEKQVASKSIALRAQSYGMPGVEVDGKDPLQVYEAVKKARERAIKGEGPTLIEAHTLRLTSHSSDDNHLVYRTKEELERLQNEDPLKLFAKYLYDAKVLNEDLEETILSEVTQEINEATEKVENAPYPDATTLSHYVYEP